MSTPSFGMAKFWETCGATVPTTTTIEQEVKRLREGGYERTLAVASRYDGIDLPDASCRILILDSRPNASTLLDEYSEACRGSSNVTTMQVARTIEQGLGRSVRGEKDYCVIVITGEELVRLIRSGSTRGYFSGQTRKQIELGLEIAEMAKAERAEDDTAMDVLKGLIKQCLQRDPAWKEFYVEEMNTVVETSADSSVLEVFQQELAAEEAHQAGDSRNAATLIQELIDARVKTTSDKGWYLQEMARYEYSVNRTEANRLQTEAHKKNHYVMRPATALQIDRLEPLGQKRAESIIEWVRSQGSVEEVGLAVADILSRLEFGVKAERFESAICELGSSLGFASQRPEKEWKEGPDNLWAVREGECFLIECKSEVNVLACSPKTEPPAVRVPMSPGRALETFEHEANQAQSRTDHQQAA